MSVGPKLAKEKLRQLLAANVPYHGSDVAMVNVDRFTDEVAYVLFFDEAYDDDDWCFD